MDTLRLYRTYYLDFQSDKFKELLGKFGLDMRRKINTFSKAV